MATPEELLDQVRDACAGLSEMGAARTAEAIRAHDRRLVGAIKSLKLVKRQAAMELRAARAHFRAEAAKIKTVPTGAGFVGNLLAHRTPLQRTIQRQNLRDAREAALQPYESVVARADGLLLELERARLSLADVEGS